MGLEYIYIMTIIKELEYTHPSLPLNTIKKQTLTKIYVYLSVGNTKRYHFTQRPLNTTD